MQSNLLILYELHVAKTKEGHQINANYTNRLIQAFGGINAVIKILLSSNNDEINIDMTQMHHLLEECYVKPETSVNIAIPKFVGNQSFDSEIGAIGTHMISTPKKVSTPYLPMISKSVNGEADENIVTEMFNKMLEESRDITRDNSKSLEIATAARVSYI